MFSTWKQEKATAGLVDEAQALADKLAGAKPHHVESHAAAARFWAASFLAEGKDLYELNHWEADAVARFAAAARVKVAALRKKREFDNSDGLVVWVHTARAILESRVAPAVRDIWQHLMDAGPNADAVAQEIILGDWHVGSVISTRTGSPFLLWVTEARSLTISDVKTSRTFRQIRSQPQTLLSTAMLKQRQIASILCHLKADTDGPYVFRKQP